MAGRLQKATLELDADIDGDGTKETGIFEMVGNLEIQQGMEVGFILASGQGSALNAVTSGTVDGIADLINADGEITNRAGFHLDLGGGRHTIELNFTGWEGAIDGDGNDLQWGNTGDPSGVTVGDATGADPLTQMHVLMEYLRIGEFDSRYPHARLEFGEYAPTGLYDDYLHVVVRSVRENRTSESPITWDGSIILEETKNWTSVIDAVGRIEW